MIHLNEELEMPTGGSPEKAELVELQEVGSPDR
jgi:hypothetical protein